MTRRRRPFATFLAIAALLFAQLQLSAHACDLPSQGRTGEAVVHMEGCPGPAPDEGPLGNLCEQHCQYGHASVDSTPPAPMSLNARGLAFKVEPAVEAISPPSRRLLPVVVPLPATILFGVLRI